MFCLKSFFPVIRAGVFIWGNFHPDHRDLGLKTEISITGPARPLIRRRRKFYEGESGEARSRKLSQPGRPSSYEEALRQWERDYLGKLDPERVSVVTFKWIAIDFIEKKKPL